MSALKPSPTTSIQRRPCDGCTACCEFLWVEEMDAPAGQPCRHQCREGCAIFGQPERPAVCNGFYCFYALGEPAVPLSPADCGVMVWVDSGEIRMRELEFAALEQPWVAHALEAWAGKPIVMERL
ncbi:MAG: hypothetical protein R3F61_13960 [Myxococcota bacterium]